MISQRRAVIHLLWLGLGSLLALNCYGGPPYLTDDPEPVEYHHWEFYLATLGTKTGRDWSGTAPHVEINYGAVPNLQLHMIAPQVLDSPGTGTAHYGYGDTELGFKYRFLQETSYRPQAGIFPLLEVPTGDADRGLGNGSLQAFLPVWLQKSWGSWTAYGGGGYGINSGAGNQDWTFVGALLQKQLLTNLSVGMEIYHQTALQIGERDNTAFNVGAVLDLSEQHHLMCSFGRSFDGPVGFQWYFAYQFTFDNSLFHFWNKPQH